jgi:hypothetical protein
MIPDFQLPLEISDIGEDLAKTLEELIKNEADYVQANFKQYTNRLKGNINPDELYNKEDWVTNRAFEYNLLKFSDRHPVLLELKSKIYESYLVYVKELNIPAGIPYVQVWFNILKKDSRFFTKHHHAHPARIGDIDDAYISGNICIRAKNTKTYYYSPYIESQKIGITNVPGEMVIFPSWVMHSTDQNQEDEPRLSIAFDIITEEMYNKGKMDNPTNYIRLDV